MGNSQPCWTCKNFATCSWSNGVPVEGWKAVKTSISYRIKSCPQYENDNLRVIKRITDNAGGILIDNKVYEYYTVQEVAKLFKLSLRTIFRDLAMGKLNRKARLKGYAAHIEKDSDNINRIYLRRLEDNERKGIEEQNSKNTKRR